MIRRNALIIAALAAAVFAVPGLSATAHADTAFTYQGRLMHNGEPYNGPVVLLMTLWDAEEDGNLLGSPIFMPDVPVSEGLFTVLVDFGEAAPGAAEIFDGSPRWLQFRVNDTQLTTRQRVTPAPHAILAHWALGAAGDFVLHPPDPGTPVKLVFGENKGPDAQGGPAITFRELPLGEGLALKLIPPEEWMGPVALAFGEGGPWFCSLGEEGVTLNNSAGGPGTLAFGPEGPAIVGMPPPDDGMPWKIVLMPPQDDGMPVALAFGEGGPSILGVAPPENDMPWKIVLKAPPDDGMPVALAFGEGGPTIGPNLGQFGKATKHPGVVITDGEGGVGSIGFGGSGSGGGGLLSFDEREGELLAMNAMGGPIGIKLGEFGAKIHGDPLGQKVSILTHDGGPGAISFLPGGPSIGGFGVGGAGIIIDNGMGDPIAIIDDNDMPMIKIAPAGGHAALTFGPGAVGLNFAPSPFGPTSPPSLNFKGAFVGFGLADGEAPSSGIQLPMAAGSPAGAGLATAWNTYSSIRWKENVQTIPDALEKVLALRGVEFDWRSEEARDPAALRDIGFIAEEVAGVVPELVVWEDGSEYVQSLKYDCVTALAVEAIKAQQREIERLRTANDALEMRLAALEMLMHSQSTALKE